MTQEVAGTHRAHRPAISPQHEHPASADGRRPGHTFRRDVEGLRALAVGLVVLFHAHVPGLNGGYVGVDIFFVISGFLITGQLLSEAARTGRISLLDFYARRARRILPAATVVLLVTVVAGYIWLGFIRASQVAQDAFWSAIFMANLHFATMQTDYLQSAAPPSPMQHYWSLSVEEQFYLAWPAGLLVVLLLLGRRRERLRTATAAVLAVVIAASFAWSAIQTPYDGTWAYFSPLTRSWELAVGAIIAAGSPALRRIPAPLATAMSWLGVAAMAGAAFLYDSHTSFPGTAVALPVLGAAAVIAAETAAPKGGAGLLLARRPLQIIGRMSYSLYLWHWPILIIAAQYAGEEPSLVENLGWVALALGLAYATMVCIEDPVRRARFLLSSTSRSLAMGALLLGVSVAVCQWQIHFHTQPTDSVNHPIVRISPGSSGT